MSSAHALSPEMPAVEMNSGVTHIGTTAGAPGLPDDETFARARRILQQRQLNVVARQPPEVYVACLPPGLREGLSELCRSIAAGVTVEQIGRGWVELVGRLLSEQIPIDVNALVQFAMRESYLETARALRSGAAKIKHFHELKIAVQQEIARARQGATAQPFILRHLNAEFQGPTRRTALLVDRTEAEGRPIVAQTPGDLDEYVLSAERWLSSAREGGLRASEELQISLERRQQALQTISSIARVLHGTAMVVILESDG